EELTPGTDGGDVGDGGQPVDGGGDPGTPDAGNGGVDAGNGGVDAGSGGDTPECTGRCDLESCGAGQACLVDEGTGEDGVCGGCATSLDCCAPSVCVDGQCLFIGG